MMYLIILLCFFLCPSFIFGQFTSPCPSLFSYDNIGGNSWTGTLRPRIDTDLSGIWLKAVFDRPFDDLGTDFGEAVHREPNEYLIRRPSPKVPAGTPLEIKITAANNPVLGAPQLLGYRINGRTVCPEQGEIPAPPPPESFLPTSGNELVSPCPGLFTYEPLPAGGNRWYGQINVRSDTELSGVWMRMVLDKPPVDFGTEFGTAEQKEPSEFLVKNPKNPVNVGQVLQFRVYADFIPGEAPPKLLGYRLNGKTVCPTNGVIEKPKGDELVSPCPSVFTYEPRGPDKDRYSGVITVVADAELSGVWMRVIFDSPLKELGTDFGEAVRRGDGDFLVRNPKNGLKTGQQLQYRVTPQFDPNGPTPKIMEIRLNARTVCPENGVVETTTLSVAQQLVSPCPELFMYEPPGAESDRWYGVINLKTDKELSGIWMRIYLDRQSVQLGNWFGEVKTEDNTLYKIQKRDYKLTPGTVLPIRFYIRYNTAEPIPKLTEIRLNAVSICSSSGTIPNSGGFPPPNAAPQQQNWLTTTPASRPFPRPDWGGAWKPPVATESPFGECGMVATKPIPLVWGGAPTEAGQWPWHGALYYIAGGVSDYYCGAALVSLRHALTAAHCVATPESANAIASNQVELVLGKHLLSNNNAAVQHMKISRLNIHPEYDFNTYANDIALIHLINSAVYSDYVRPVCLWTENTDLSSVVNREGTVVGWGYDSTGQVTDKLLKAAMPVVPHGKCIWSNKPFYKRVLNDRNFCAGFRNGTSVCTGDSGGGLVFPTPGTNSRWQIRGLVSLSVALQDSTSKCDTSHYVVFTDVAKFLPWIQKDISSG